MGRIVLCLMFGLSGCETGELAVEQRPIIEDEVPVVEHNDTGEQVAQRVLLSGVVDDDQVLGFLNCRLSTQQAGTLWEGNPNPDGTWQWEGQLAPGLHVVRFEAADVSGNVSVDEWELFVRFNEAPSCRIESPKPGSYSQSEALLFKARANDSDDDELELYWSSDQEGTLFEGYSWSLMLQNPGRHLIEFSVVDPFGASCVDRVEIMVY